MRNVTQLATIILAYVYDNEVKLAIRNFVPNVKGILKYQPEQ